jgi:hypothetical protein
VAAGLRGQRGVNRLADHAPGRLTLGRFARWVLRCAADPFRFLMVATARLWSGDP